MPTEKLDNSLAEEINALVATHQENPGLRSLHKALADDFTERVHGQSGLEDARMLTLKRCRHLKREVHRVMPIGDWAIASQQLDGFDVALKQAATGPERTNRHLALGDSQANGI